MSETSREMNAMQDKGLRRQGLRVREKTENDDGSVTVKCSVLPNKPTPGIRYVGNADTTVELTYGGAS